jgi:hypothetical protein
MRARFVFEKFTDTDSDPIRDMGIGMFKQIEAWIKTLGLWYPPNINNTSEVLKLCIQRGKKDFIKFLIDVRDDYDKNGALNTCLYYDQYEFIDVLLDKGAKFESLEDKARYIIKLKGKRVSFTPEEALLVSCKIGDFSKFVDLVESGVKLKIGMINALFMGNIYPYANLGKVNEKDDILQYLRDNIDDLEKIVHPGNYKKLERIKTLLGVEKSKGYREYPRGYKIYRILKFIDEVKPLTRREITKFIFELTYGKGTFNPLLNDSYWSTNFPTTIFPNTAIGSQKRFILNIAGKNKLKMLDEKFKKMNVTSYI